MGSRAYSGGVPIAATPLPIWAFWPRSRPELSEAFPELYPHTKGHSFSSMYLQGRVALCRWLERLKGRQKKRKVILPSYGAESLYYATIGAGLEIVLCDVDLADTLFDLDDLDRVVQKHTGDILAAVVPYNWGVIDLAKARAIHTVLAKHGIVWVDDFAQTQPLAPSFVEYFRSPSISLFSFTGTKIISSMCGGMLTFSADMPVEYKLEPSDSSCSEMPLISPNRMKTWLYGERRKHRFLFRDEREFRVQRDMYPTSLAISRVALSRDWKQLLAGLVVSYGDYLRRKRTSHNRTYSQIFNGSSIRTFPSANGDALGARYMVLFPSSVSRDKCQEILFGRHFWTSRGYIHMIPHVECIRPYLTDEDKDEQRFPAAIELERRLLTFPNHYLLRESDFESVRSVLQEL